MSEQTLFDLGTAPPTGDPLAAKPNHPAKRDDPASSHQSAREVEATGSAGAQRRAAIALVERHPGHTSLELAQYGQLDRLQLARRLPECAKAGHLTRKDYKRCSVSGKKAVTWWPREF